MVKKNYVKVKNWSILNLSQTKDPSFHLIGTALNGETGAYETFTSDQIVSVKLRDNIVTTEKSIFLLEE